MASFPTYGQLDLDAYREQPQPAVIRTEMDSGLVKQARIYPKQLKQRPVKMIYSATEKASFETWLDSTINLVDWFDWEDPADGTTKQARIVGGIYDANPFASSPGSPLSYEVSFTLETIE